MSGRPTIGDHTMTPAERARRYRAKRQAAGIPTRDQLHRALGRAVMDIIISDTNTTDVAPIIDRAIDILADQKFPRRPTAKAIRKLAES